MTTREQIEQLLLYRFGPVLGDVVDALERIVADAVKAERAACAKIAAEYNGAGLDHDYQTQLGDAELTRHDILDAITKRGEAT